jgi:arylsulfatase
LKILSRWKNVAWDRSEFSADDGMDVGRDTSLRVTYTEPKGYFTGDISWVQLDLGIEDYNHFLTAEERYRAAMMRK